MTNINGLKNVSKMLLHIPVEECDLSPAIVIHPYFDAGISFDGENLVNILEDSSALERCIKRYEAVIDRATKPIDLMVLLKSQYAMTWLKYGKEYLSKEDFSRLLGDAWVNCENANMDKNVPISESVEWFRNADKERLMYEDEYAIYKDIPERITLYRGVSRGRKEKGMSWTDDRQKAEWFADRFGKGYLLTMTADKKDVLAYFSRRGESEYLVYPKKYKRVE